MAKFEYSEWLLLWFLRTGVFRFEWDLGNKAKSTLKHGVSTEEVEEVFSLGMALPLGLQVQPLVDEPRFAITGPTYSNQVLTIVFTLREGRVRTISARPAHKKEREQYEQGIRPTSKGI